MKYVHSLNRLHLDIKPGNIMVDKNGKAILIDFGASKHYDDESGENTSTLLGVNTKGYAPIEQSTQSFTSFSPATDIYALGATLYKLLTGITPPDANLLVIEEESLQPLPSNVSSSTRKVVSKSMQLRRKDRPQSIVEFVELFGIKEHSEGIAKAKESIKDDVARKKTKVLRDNENYIDESTLIEDNVCIGTYGAHEWVDLGLPSGIKWASCNIGANVHWDFGTYFEWGRTRKKLEGFDIGLWDKGVKGLKSNGIIDSCLNLSMEHDTARQKWGRPWRLPTLDEFKELITECSWEWVTKKGHNGYIVIGPNGNSIFLPAAGNRNSRDTNGANIFGNYWTAKAYSGRNSAYTLSFSSSNYCCNHNYRSVCASVRPVTNNSNK